MEETAREYLLSVIKYLQRPGDWTLTSPEATVDHALELHRKEMEE